MTAHLERALVLLQQSRFDLAEPELRQALARDPEDAYAHALLALALARRQQFKEATEEVEQAVHLAPDFPFAHYARASIFHDRNRLPEAVSSVEEAIRLNPTDADFHALLAQIRLDKKQWEAARMSAEAGLQNDPEHLACTNLRAIALVKLGRKQEAGATIDAALARNPENAITHANKGWTLLEKGNSEQALEHFREALRLDPENEWARNGIVEALKARHRVYALMLRYFLWMAKLSPGAQWGIILGGFFANRFLTGLARTNPEWAPWVLPLRIAYISFVVMTWTAGPLFNLLLRLNKFGRLALSEEAIRASNWIGGLVFGALAMLALWIPTQNGTLLIAAMVFGFLVIPMAGVFNCERGWPKTAMIAYTAAMGMVGAGALLLKVAEQGAGEGLFSIFFVGAFLSCWVANGLMMVQPKR